MFPTLLELCISEFHIPRREFLFSYTLPSVIFLMEARAERNQSVKEEENTVTSSSDLSKPASSDDDYASLDQMLRFFGSPKNQS